MAALSKTMVATALSAVATFLSSGAQNAVESIKNFVDPRAPGAVWKLVALVFALANFKMLPGMWHVSFPVFVRNALESTQDARGTGRTMRATTCREPILIQ